MHPHCTPQPSSSAAAPSSSAAAAPSSASPAHPLPGIFGAPPPDLAYDPARAAAASRGLEPDVAALIAAFSPSRVELFPALCPFLPDFVPAAGDMDAFLKPPRPDGREDELGAKRLDEPAALQSDPTVLDLQLRALSKKSGLDPVAVRALENADKAPKEVLKWVASLAELRRAAPPPSVRYTKPMPEVDALMQVWPEEFEALLRQVRRAPPPTPPPPPPATAALPRCRPAATRPHTRVRTRTRTHRPPLPPSYTHTHARSHHTGAAALGGAGREPRGVRAAGVRAAGHPGARGGRGGGRRGAGAAHPVAAPALHAV